MSDVFSRVAARAVGAAPLAQPRLPAPFERSGGGHALEVLDEERLVTAPESAVAPAAAEPSSPAARDKPLRESHAPADSPARDATADDRVTPRAAQRLPRAASSPLRRRASRPQAPPAETASPEQVAPAAVEPSAPATPAAPVVAAVPASRQPVPPPAVTRAPAARAETARREEETVRVHIGRLEIRANLQPPAPPPRSRERPAADELSLHDYLAGKRP